MKAILIMSLSSMLAGCLMGTAGVSLYSYPVLGQSYSYTITEEQIVWDKMEIEFVFNNIKGLRHRTHEFGKSNDWVKDPSYYSGEQTPFALSMWIEVTRGAAIFLDPGSVKLNYDASSKLFPWMVSVEATEGHSVCHLMNSGAVAYSQPVSLSAGPIPLATLPQRRGEQGCIRFIFDVPIEEMDPSNKFSLSVTFIIDGKERAETIYFGPREINTVAR